MGRFVEQLASVEHPSLATEQGDSVVGSAVYALLRVQEGNGLKPVAGGRAERRGVSKVGEATGAAQGGGEDMNMPPEAESGHARRQ